MRSRSWMRKFGRWEWDTWVERNRSWQIRVSLEWGLWGFSIVLALGPIEGGIMIDRSSDEVSSSRSSRL